MWEEKISEEIEEEENAEEIKAKKAYWQNKVTGIFNYAYNNSLLFHSLIHI
jgi:hypothetical protein